MKQQTVKQFMTCNPVIISPEYTLEEAAAKMDRVDCGVFPVGTEEHIQGIITDRDIVVRALGRQRNVRTTRVNEIMTKHIYSVPEDASIEQAADIMRKHQVSRLLVKDAGGKVIGILSLGHFVRNADPAMLSKIVQHTLAKKAA